MGNRKTKEGSDGTRAQKEERRKIKQIRSN